MFSKKGGNFGSARLDLIHIDFDFQKASDQLEKSTNFVIPWRRDRIEARFTGAIDGINFDLVADQEFDHRELAEEGGGMQGGGAVPVCGVDVRPGRKEQLGGFELTG